MAKPVAQSIGSSQSAQDKATYYVQQIGIVVGVSLFVALCARVTIPLPFTPVPLTVQNFGVLLVGLLLGSRRGFAAMALYLAEGAAGLPVFNPLGVGGVAQLFGPTGGYLMAYPFVAFLAGYIFEGGAKSFLRAAVAGVIGEIVLFAGGLGWLYIVTHSLAKAVFLGLYWFLAAEVMKVMFAAAIATRWKSRSVSRR
ncbi:MAG TPA: biotin transporter BioY [Candidatus Acidoferrales bacterium]|nr:biotin transporter BioY [Candidatus Acidoferrales bacterium]